MPASEDRHEIEEAAALLVGHAITGVRYLGWWQAAPEEPEAYVEYVEITMDDGAVLRVSADADESGTYGVSIYEGAYPASFDGIQVLDAGTREGWRRVLGAVVTESIVHWADIEVAKIHLRNAHAESSRAARPAVSVRSERVVVPSDLELRFDGRETVFLTASAWEADGTLIFGSDNVAVVFGDHDAERLEVGRWRAGRVARGAAQ